MPHEQEIEALSRTLLHALRHAPDQYYLEVDSGGWTSLDNTALAMRYSRAAWSDVTVDELRQLVTTILSDRIEIAADQIRARYGHSIALAGANPIREPPYALYHGTCDGVLSAIDNSGLQPMRRQRVHLTSDIQYAWRVANAKGDQPVLLEIATTPARQAGVVFHLATTHVWLADQVPSRFIRVRPVRSDANRLATLGEWPTEQSNGR